MGDKPKMKGFFVVVALVLLAVCVQAGNEPEQLYTPSTYDEPQLANHTNLIPPAGIVGRGQVLRTCMNHCGGLCQQLCAKFKTVKVCNGCVRGCFKRCDVKQEIVMEGFEMQKDAGVALPPYQHTPTTPYPQTQNH